MAHAGYGLTVASVPKIGTNYYRTLASREDVEWGLVSQYGEDEHPSVVVRDHSEPGDKIGEVYDRMLHTDPVLAGLVQKRTKAVVGLPWDIIPADESPRAIEVADFVRWNLRRIHNIEANLAHQLGGVYRGRAFDELIWGLQTSGPWRGAFTVEEIIDRPMSRFGFKRGEMHVRTKEGGLRPVPPAKFLSLCHGTKDNPWGKALLDDVWWFTWMSLHVWKYWGVSAEKWPQPTVVISYPRGNDGSTDEKTIADALSIGADVQTEYAIAKPADIAVDFLQAQRSGDVSYELFAAYLDRAKALVVLGEPDTSGLSKGPGSYAKNRVADEVRFETILADATEVGNSWTDGLIAPLVRVNYGRDAPIPYMEFDVEEANDRAQRQAGAQVIFDAGYPVPKDYYYRLHQVPLPKAGQPTMRGPWVPSTPRPPGVGASTAPATPAEDWSEQEVA